MAFFARFQQEGDFMRKVISAVFAFTALTLAVLSAGSANAAPKTYEQCSTLADQRGFSTNARPRIRDGFIRRCMSGRQN
jgi:hypothetical protein